MVRKLVCIEIYFYLGKGIDSIGKMNGRKIRKMSLRTESYQSIFASLSFAIKDL